MSDFLKIKTNSRYAYNLSNGYAFIFKMELNFYYKNNTHLCFKLYNVKVKPPAPNLPPPYNKHC